jgi:MYXO-CTERM domain-containing protein
MRTMIPVLLAAALRATPAAAQDANNTAAAAPPTADVNAAAPAPAADMNAAAPLPANDVAAAPDATTPVDTAQQPANDDNDSGGFPWGVVGLLGLIGLIPRRRR